MGSAFIATREARAADGYKEMIVESRADDIVYSNLFTGIHGNYLKPSIVAAGMDPDKLPVSDASAMNFGSGGGSKSKAWRDIWGCGQGIGGDRPRRQRRRGASTSSRANTTRRARGSPNTAPPGRGLEPHPLRHRVLERDALEHRVALAAKALHAAGVAPVQSVALLLRNDFAFVEASVAAQTIGAYATPINWHNTPDEIGYVLRDCGAPVLVGHDDLLAKLGDAVPAGVAVLAVATPPEIAAAYGVSLGASLEGRRDWDEWLAAAADAPTPPPAPQTGSMIYTSGTTGRPKGVKRQPTAEAERAARHANTERAYG